MSGCVCVLRQKNNKSLISFSNEWGAHFVFSVYVLLVPFFAIPFQSINFFFAFAIVFIISAQVHFVCCVRDDLKRNYGCVICCCTQIGFVLANNSWTICSLFFAETLIALYDFAKNFCWYNTQTHTHTRHTYSLRRIAASQFGERQAKRKEKKLFYFKPFLEASRGHRGCFH